MPPEILWRNDGLNLIGFPIASDNTTALSNFLKDGGLLDSSTQIYEYYPGPLGENNPAATIPRYALAERGEAFWIRSGRYSNYYGPLQVNVPLASNGLDFGSGGSVKRLTLKNFSNTEMTVNLENIASESAPGETAIPSKPGLLVQSRDGETGLYTYEPMGDTHTLTIPPNSSTGLTLGLDRTSLTGSADGNYASVLKITDGKDMQEVYLPVTAEESTLAGLWVGEAAVTQVQNQLQRFLRDENGNHILDENGQYILVSTEQGLNETDQSFPLRFIIHCTPTGEATLLSEIYQGVIA
ncbi:hypothetical protein [Roseibacillus ishigakijimensis]|uniref:Uncharacterized protein n=1 Tax=Roseibacillus ishigakijimensis TaxID=454146 RepID=A0A934VKF5_9BACT|nr:hypothetical protein [Roseibacillus ishigakijimensis]MBK1833599.1 hypothetical protein [Roseibacillus ishigakijimensis]